MSIWSRLTRRESPSNGPTFDGVEIDPAMIYGAGWNLVTGTAWTPPLSPRVSRAEAMSVPAVKRSRDLIAGGIGALQLELIGPDNKPVEPAWSLFVQPEAGVPAPVTWTNLAEDLLFEKVGWLRVTFLGWHGKPVEGVRLDPRTTTVQPEMRVWSSATGNGMSAGYIPDEQLIRFDSPNDALLRSGARAIRSLLRLEAAASNYTDGTPPIEFFTPVDPDDPGDEDDVQDLLDKWQAKRRLGGPAYVPAALRYNTGSFNPEQLQLAQAREFAISEIARLTGIDTEELGVSTTSRTYFNAFDRTQSFIQFTLMPYMRAIEARLSMDDVTPRGYRARFNVDELFRADTLSRYQAYEVGLRSKAITEDEIRTAEGKPLLTGSERAAIPAPAAETTTAPTTTPEGAPTNA